MHWAIAEIVTCGVLLEVHYIWLLSVVCSEDCELLTIANKKTKANPLKEIRQMSVSSYLLMRRVLLPKF